MEFRKLIKFGNSSFVVSIPGNWLKKNKLVKGDVVYLEEDEDSRLILYSRLNKKREEKEIIISTDKKQEYRVKDEIYRAYTDGYDVFKLIGNNVDKYSEEVRKHFNNFVAVEVLEQTNERLVAKNFLNVDDVSIKDVIRRIDIILRGMLKDSIECINGEDYESIVQRDVDVNRFCFMLERILKCAMNDPEISRKINLKGTELLHVWYIVLNLESMGDEIKRISRFLSGIKFNEIQVEEIRNLYIDIEKSYLDAMRAYYKNDMKLAFDVSHRKEELHERCNKFFEKNQIMMVSGMIEKMKALVSWIRTFAIFAYD